MQLSYLSFFLFVKVVFIQTFVLENFKVTRWICLPAIYSTSALLSLLTSPEEYLDASFFTLQISGQAFFQWRLWLDLHFLFVQHTCYKLEFRFQLALIQEAIYIKEHTQSHFYSKAHPLLFVFLPAPFDYV